MSELKPCPFCGGEATISDGGYSGEKFLARCRELSCPAASGFIRKTHDEAIAAWNRRAILDGCENEMIVRCESCKHYNRIGCSKGFGWCESMDRGVSDDFYCANGAKMDGGIDNG